MTVSLTELKILALDCQATGANPQKGHLIELGWMSAGASSAENSQAGAVKAYLNLMPKDEKIPRAVSRLTGITDNLMTAAETSNNIWQHLMVTVKEVNSENQMAVCPTVIHFARFEVPFLKDLHRKNGPEYPFPFQIICTHDIAIRLLPDLPRRGLRAIAGYFSHSMPEFKRSADHVVATVFIWKKMIEMLNAKQGVYTLDQLNDWLASTEPAGRSRRIYPMAPGKRLRLPEKPGIYRMLRANSDLLYIGKAKSLRMRINSYFRENAHHAEHILEMLTQAHGLDYTLTGSAVEAAMLESDEIKRHSPPYNIALRNRQRKLAYFTKDLSRHSTVSDRQSIIGPLPDGKFIAALSAFGYWITRDCHWTDQDLAVRGCNMLGVSPEYAPDLACLKEGLEMFKVDHLDYQTIQSPLRLLTSLGAMLWRRRLEDAQAAKAAEQNPDDNKDDDVPPKVNGNERVWTPQAVAKSIAHMLMHSAHLIRRARWFCLLSESSLSWEGAGRPGQLINLIVLEGGSVIKRGAMRPAEEIPAPPRFDRPFHRRQTHLNLITYDRLRVLTTELRRLIAEKRLIELRLGPTVTLRNDEMQRALRWV